MDSANARWPMGDDLAASPAWPKVIKAMTRGVLSMVHAQRSIQSSALCNHDCSLTQNSMVLHGVARRRTQAVRVFTAEVEGGRLLAATLARDAPPLSVPAFDPNLDPLSPLTVCG